MNSLLCTPIAFVESPYRQRIDAPHQPSVVQGTATGDAAQARIVFIDGFPGEAYRDLAGFGRIWLIFAFNRSQGWKTEVRPPRGGGKRSVLATRSPHRPNAIGLSAVELLSVEGWRTARARGRPARWHADPRHQAVRALCRCLPWICRRLDRCARCREGNALGAGAETTAPLAGLAPGLELHVRVHFQGVSPDPLQLATE
jgi:tRNA (Thr-GGU) A37 N-methylase